MAGLYRIPKEIKGDNKVAFGMNIRQLIAVGIGAALAVTVILTTGISFDYAGIVALCCGIVSWCFGWKTFDGLSAEEFLLKQVRELVYRSSVRTYRTRNRYITQINEQYQRLRMADRKDKEACRLMKKQRKLKRKMKSTLKITR